MERPAHRRDDRAADLIADGVLPAKVLGLAPRGHQREPPPQGRVPLQSQDAFPSSKFSIDQNRHGIGKSQPIRIPREKPQLTCRAKMQVCVARVSGDASTASAAALPRV
eukprot:COSAG01_NODE_7249_length_3283_cov_3.343593_4_plen_109_part_00